MTIGGLVIASLKKPEAMKPPTSNHFFGGMGGFIWGLSEAGFRPVFATDIEPSACETLEYCWGEQVKVLQADILKLDAEAIPEAEVWTGGFPCQPFSRAGEKRGFDDPRTKPFLHLIRLLKQHKNPPRIVALENVEALMRNKSWGEQG